MISLCNGWDFSENWSREFLEGGGSFSRVRLPHEVRPVPQHYAVPKEHYEGVFGYRRTVDIPATARGKRLFLQFDGAAHQARVYWNGRPVGGHRCGYTGFRVEVTDFVDWSGENRLAVRLDSREDGTIPPFGFVIDYLTYGGLYREAWLDIREPSYIRDLFILADRERHLSAQVEIDGTDTVASLEVWDGETCLARTESGTELQVPEAELWSPENPKLYTCRVMLTGGDVKQARFGFRSVEFCNEGCRINGQRIFLRGLNRHQSYPCLGYGAPASLQREDARILKEELGCNAVRTSHYPQSRHFLEACDELGLLVFTELPGWQHIGNEAWKTQALQNLQEMVVQNRNHPGIVLWGVRINESQDDEDFYRRTNDLCRRLDPTRPTSGVRYLEKSRLLEDVYAYNDFSHSGDNPGVKPKKAVTPDRSRPLLISEHSGHMFPTKSFDPWEKRQEQALRHGRVLAEAMGDGEHAGCFGWCMFDYATHQDFGSGDRVCYHGVLDAYRNPKPAAALYASQQEEIPVLEVGSSMDIGDYPAGNLGKVYIFTNADEVDVYRNDMLVTTLRERQLGALPHGPMLLEDSIGQLLQTQEGFTGAKERLLHRCLVSAGKYGLNMPLGDKLRMGWCMLRCRMSFADGMALYGKYVSNWGGEATRWRFEARKNGRVVRTVLRGPGNRLHLEAVTSSTVLQERDTYDMAAVRIRIADENGNTAVYAQLPVSLSLTGPAELAGPSIVTAEGGMCGTYVKTTGTAGTARLRLTTPQTEPLEIAFVCN